MKLKGIFGKGSGKLGNAVFAVSGGEQLVKEYNPRVSNPNTPAQVEQRAKFKLLSQLAAVFAPAMAFRKKGLVSARNQFVSKNIGAATYAEGKANMNLTVIDLTGGHVACPSYNVTEGENNQLTFALDGSAPAHIKGMVYIIIDSKEELNLSLVDIKVVTEAGVNNTFPGTLQGSGYNSLLYAYGIMSVGDEESVSFGEMGYNDTEVEATLLIDKLAKSAGVAFTATKWKEI